MMHVELMYLVTCKLWCRRNAVMQYIPNCPSMDNMSAPVSHFISMIPPLSVDGPFAWNLVYTMNGISGKRLDVPHDRCTHVS
jgi:hypothetical protein